MVCWLKHVRENHVMSVMNVAFMLLCLDKVEWHITATSQIVPSTHCYFTVSYIFVMHLCIFHQFYRCFLALLCCEAPRRGSSIKSSSKVATKAMRGAAATGPRRTNDFLFMVASLGQPAATMPQLGPSFEATNDITKAPSSDTNKPVVVSLVAHFDGWWLATTLEIPKVPSQEVMNNLSGDSTEVWRAAACRSRQIWHCCCISCVLGSRDHGLITKANLGLPLDNKSRNQRQ